MFQAWIGKSRLERLTVAAAGALLEADLGLPPDARGVVLFPHGSGIARVPQDGLLALQFRRAGLATVLLNLLTAEEQNLDARVACFRFDIPLLTGRLAAVTDWLVAEPQTAGLPLGYFAGSNASAAALAAAAGRDDLAAIVLLNGRPDLAESALANVAAPALFLVGGNDESMIGLNRVHLEALGSAERKCELVAGGPLGLEDPDALGEAVGLAEEWFTAHLHPRHEPPRTAVRAKGDLHVRRGPQGGPG